MRNIQRHRKESSTVEVIAPVAVFDSDRITCVLVITQANLKSLVARKTCLKINSLRRFNLTATFCKAVTQKICLFKYVTHRNTYVKIELFTYIQIFVNIYLHICKYYIIYSSGAYVLTENCYLKIALGWWYKWLSAFLVG